MSATTNAPAPTNTEPTRNPRYNDLLVRWAKEGSACKPECEECGISLVGRNVYEGRFGWFCINCIDEQPEPLPAGTVLRDEGRERFGAD